MSSHHHSSIFEDQARELYYLCDEEKKGYILKDDMFRLKSHLRLTDEQLIAVFDSLDDDGNGTLTFEEFILGFGKFLGANFDTPFEEESETQNESMMDGAAKEHLDHLLEKVSNTGLNDDIELIKETWFKLQNENPDLLTNFERIIDEVTTDVSKSKNECQSLENVLKNKSYNYEEEIKNIYDDLDNQRKTEKERILKEERLKEIKLKTELENQIREKDNLLQNIQSDHDKIARELQKLMDTNCESNQERERLEKEKLLMEEKLKQSDKALQDCKEYIEDLNKKAKQDKRKRAKAAIEMTEGIALERENLVRQLDELKEVNKELVAEKERKRLEKAHLKSLNELNLSNELSMCNNDAPPIEEPNVVEVHDRKKRGSILSSYFTPLINVEKNKLENGDDLYKNESIIEENMSSYQSLDAELMQCNFNSNIVYSNPSTNEIEIQTDQIDNDLGERLPPDGAGEETREETSGLPDKPERIFKVVLIGDSSVGKTSILKRFCNDDFREDGIASTIGVDFQIRSMRVDGYYIALQLWDTAGQERFRSITSQYYRKADGVILVYDVSNEASFLNLREWVINVKDAVEDNTAIMILENKSDKPEEYHINVDYDKIKSHLSDDEVLFYRCSAKSGLNINESFEALTKILTKNENNDLNTSLNLEKSQKKGCCGRK